MPFDPRTTAVVLIEYQNDFVSEGGALHGAVEAVMDKTDMLANTKKMVQAARAAGATIMHAPITSLRALRSKGIETLVLGGFLTNCCVESTMRSGYENGYKVITLSDCVAATSVEEHENALTYDYPMFSQPMTSQQFIAEL
jgi:nicotinamidase-related amidase